MTHTLARRLLLATCCLLLASHVGAAQPASDASATPGVKRDIEPRAVDIIEAMSEKLAGAGSMKFTALVSEESPSRLGPALVYSTRSDVSLRRPDKLKVITPGDGAPHEFYYDGSTIVAYSPAEDLVAVAAAPETITAALKMAFETAAIYFPFTDVIVDDPYAAISSDMQLAYYIGQSNVVGDTTTDMIAYANGDVFVQAWIGTKDHLPRKLRAVFADDPLRLRHQVEFSNWQLDGVAAGESFASDKATKAKRIPFARPDQQSTAPKSVSGGDKP